MDYMTTKEFAEKWGITDRRILQYCNDGRISGAVKMGNTWLIPKCAQKPKDERYKENRKINSAGGADGEHKHK